MDRPLALPTSFAERKFAEHRRLTAVNGLWCAGLAGLLWLWDWVIAPDAAPRTLGLRLAMVAGTVVLVGVAGWPGTPWRWAKAALLSVAPLLTLLFFLILQRMPQAVPYGVGGFLFLQMAGFALWQGLRWHETLASHLGVAALPPLLALLTGTSFPMAAYAVMVLPAALACAAVQHVNARRYREACRMRDRLQELASDDPLTGALNRRAFDAQANQVLMLARRHQQPVSLVLIDLDHFRHVNEHFGHATGDEVLRRLAGVVRTVLRASDLLGRWGGEVFVCLLPATDRAGALRAAARMLTAVRRMRVGVPGGEIALTASLGVVTLDEDASLKGENGEEGPSLDLLVRRAESALHRAKQGGRDQLQSD